MAGKLFIYDTYDENNVAQAKGRFSRSANVTEIATDSIEDLLVQLVGLRRRGATFDRVLFQTHGRPGAITFGRHDAIIASTWPTRFGGQGLDQLFPSYTRIYFDGCEVAAGDGGTQFLVEAGRVLTRRGAGEVFAFTNVGYGFPGVLPLIGGKTYHIAGPLKTAYFLAGGILHGMKFGPSLLESTIAASPRF